MANGSIRKRLEPLTSEIARWPGVIVEFEHRSRHILAKLSYGEERGMVTVAVSPRSSRSMANCIGDLRRTLKGMGASKEEGNVEGS